VFYAEFDGQRKNRVIVKVLGWEVSQPVGLLFADYFREADLGVPTRTDRPSVVASDLQPLGSALLCRFSDASGQIRRLLLGRPQMRSVPNCLDGSL